MPHAGRSRSDTGRTGIRDRFLATRVGGSGFVAWERVGPSGKCVRDIEEMESRHVSIWIEVPPEAVYSFAADPQTWPRWAAGLAEGGLRQSADGGWPIHRWVR